MTAQITPSIKTENQAQLLQAMQFTARWGFLSKEIYFKHFCHRHLSKQYRQWKMITKSGFFVRSKVNKNICYLTAKGRKVLKVDGQPARFHLYIEHDTLVAELVLTLQREKKIMRYWIESELKSDLMTAYSVLGGERIDRFPDAVIDVMVGGRVERYAIEIERKVKSNFRYNKMVMSYSNYEKLKGVLFGCNTSSTVKTIQKSFFDSQLAKTDFKIGTYLCDDFKSKGLSSAVETRNNSTKLDQFLLQSLNISSDKNIKSEVGIDSHLENGTENEKVL